MGEFTKTWQYTDIDKNIKLPFITIVRKQDAQQGTNYAGTFNIPGRPTFTYMKIPTWEVIGEGTIYIKYHNQYLLISRLV